MSLNVPASHGWHFALPSSELEPIPQESHVVEFACSLFVFVGQLLHDGWPDIFWYVPLQKMYREKADEEKKIKLVNKNKANHLTILNLITYGIHGKQDP